MYKIGKVYYKIMARGQVGGLTSFLTWRENGPKVSDGEKPGWRDNQGRDNQVLLYFSTSSILLLVFDLLFSFSFS